MKCAFLLEPRAGVEESVLCALPQVQVETCWGGGSWLSLPSTVVGEGVCFCSDTSLVTLGLSGRIFLAPTSPVDGP